MVTRTHLSVTLAIVYFVCKDDRYCAQLTQHYCQASSDGRRPSDNHDALRLIPWQRMRDLWWTNQNEKSYLCYDFGSSFSFISPTTLHLKPQRYSFSPSKQNTRHTHARTHTHRHKHLAFSICYRQSVSDCLQFGYRFSNASEWRRSRDSAVGIATRYGLDGPGIESRWEWDFPHPSTPALGPTQPLIQRGTASFPGVKRGGAWRWPPTPSSAEVKERVQQCIYSPSGPSWPVLRWTLTSPLIFAISKCFLIRNKI